MPYSTEIQTQSAPAEWLETTYPIMEHFHTIQGEGVHTGKSAYFIRTGGCDVQCWWCDVKDSWDESKHPRITVRHILENIKLYKPAFVVITGGEPLLHAQPGRSDYRYPIVGSDCSYRNKRIFSNFRPY